MAKEICACGTPTTGWCFCCKVPVCSACACVRVPPDQGARYCGRCRAEMRAPEQSERRLLHDRVKQAEVERDEARAAHDDLARDLAVVRGRLATLNDQHESVGDQLQALRERFAATRDESVWDAVDRYLAGQRLSSEAELRHRLGIIERTADERNAAKALNEDLQKQLAHVRDVLGAFSSESVLEVARRARKERDEARVELDAARRLLADERVEADRVADARDGLRESMHDLEAHSRCPRTAPCRD